MIKEVSKSESKSDDSLEILIFVLTILISTFIPPSRVEQVAREAHLHPQAHQELDGCPHSRHLHDRHPWPLNFIVSN